MKKSNLFYFIAIVVGLGEFIKIFLTYISYLNLSKISGSIEYYYLYLVIVIITIPLFILSIINMIKSLKEEKEVSKKAIFCLMLNLFIMFFTSSYLTVYTFKLNYNQYSEYIESGYSTDIFRIYQKNLVINLIRSYISPIIYIVSAVLAYIFKSDDITIIKDKDYEPINEELN